MSYLDRVVGAAVFDLNGLPKEYFTTSEHSNMSWVQTIFQTLGLRSLLMSSLQLEGFQYAVIDSKDFHAVVVKQKAQYIALLSRKSEDRIGDGFIQWAQSLQMDELERDRRFRIA
jgi:hypothetical protein